MTDKHAPDDMSPDNPERNDSDTAGQKVSSNAPTDSPPKKGRAFASNAPWVGSEHTWKKEKTTGNIERPENVSEAPTGSIPVQPSSTPDAAPAPTQKTISVRPDSYPPDYNLEAMGRSSLPAIAAQSEANKNFSNETKLGIAATVLATIIVISLLTWYFLDVRSESAQTKEMQTVQKMMIERLQHRIQEMDSKDPSNAETQAIRKKVRALAAQLLEAQKKASGQEVATLPSDDGAYEKSSPANSQGSNTGFWLDSFRSRAEERPQSTDDSTSTSREDSTDEKPVEDKKEDSEETDGLPASPYASNSLSSELSKKKEQDQLDSLLGTSTQKSATPEETQVQKPVMRGPTKPLVPSREQVRIAMSAVGPTVKKCGDGTGGKIKMEMAISGETGRVISAQPISSEYAGTTKGICATRAVSLAKFPKFQKRTLVIKYPFDL